MTEKIQNEIDKFISENGNANFTHKDLLIYIVQKIDNLPCVSHVKTIQTNKAKVDMLMWIYGISTAAIIGLLMYILSKL